MKMRKKPANSALESDPVFGWFLIIALSVLLPIPFAVIAHMFGNTAGPIIWLGMVIAFPVWAIWLGYKPFR